MKINKRFLLYRMFSCVLICLSFVAGAQASLLDKVVEFYTSSVPNPPRIELDSAAVRAMVETGDIIIENNRAFPQWYAVIGSLVPNSRFVHAGMVVKGHVLKALAQEIRPASVHTLHAYYRGELSRVDKGKVKKVFGWKPCPVDPNGIYVVTPEVTINTSISKIVALDLKDYLVDPAIGYPTKHIRIIRPRLSDQAVVRTLAKYLTYHVIKQTTYDMGFVATEKEEAIVRDRNGELWFDFSAAPVPLYCTELVYRALREVGITVPTVRVRRGISVPLSSIPRMPRSVLQKLEAPFITADVLQDGGTVIYQNQEPPSVLQAIGAMVDLNFKATCNGLVRKVQAMIGKNSQ